MGRTGLRVRGALGIGRGEEIGEAREVGGSCQDEERWPSVSKDGRGEVGGGNSENGGTQGGGAGPMGEMPETGKGVGNGGYRKDVSRKGRNERHGEE